MQPLIEFIERSKGFAPILLEGVFLTILVTLGSLVVSTLLGLVWALLRISKNRLISNFSKAITNFLRGIPILVILFYVYFVLPELGITLTAVQAGIGGLGLAYSAYQAENFRAGIESIDKGQWEASLSLGMSRITMLRRVIMPQAVRLTLPPFGNTSIMMLKDSSQASTITVAELTLKGQSLAYSTFDNFTVFTLVAMFYLCLSLPLIIGVGWLERHKK